MLCCCGNVHPIRTHSDRVVRASITPRITLVYYSDGLDRLGQTCDLTIRSALELIELNGELGIKCVTKEVVVQPYVREQGLRLGRRLRNKLVRRHAWRMHVDKRSPTHGESSRTNHDFERALRIPKAGDDGVLHSIWRLTVVLFNAS